MRVSWTGFFVSGFLTLMKTLARSLDSIGFVEREREDGKQVPFKCGRDFLYYALNFYFPEKFNPSAIGPIEIDRQKLFGSPMPKHLAWTQLQFKDAPNFLKSLGLTLFINNREIRSYAGFMFGNALGGFFSSMKFEGAMQEIERCVDANIACAVDMPVGKKWMLFLDHVMFVYGYDDDNLYVFDTLSVPLVAYERMNTDVHYYKLPKAVIRKNWSSLGRVWRIEKSA